MPELQVYDRQAWTLWRLGGKNQTEVAELLSRKHGVLLGQGQVSKMCKRFQAYIDAGGVTDDLPKPSKRVRATDPERLELGPRTDPRKPRPSDLGALEND